MHGAIAAAALRRGLGLIGMLGMLLLAPSVSAQQNPGANETRPGVHLGVATCSGSNCHGALEPVAGSNVENNEFITWSRRDRHRLAYQVLLEERAIRIARALGLPDAANQKLCLDCHADNPPSNLRGRQFQVSDGVGCEACHGGASGWLGSHISGATHLQNVQAGLYPTEQPIARAERCLSCHFGDSTKFVDHRLMGAGHPPLPFELSTFTAIQPAHFVVDKDYIERKGRTTNMQVWTAGELMALSSRMDALLSPQHGHRGPFPEFVLFDCESCHHAFDGAKAPLPSQTGLGPGTVKLNDANAVMLRVAASRVAPAAAQSLSQHMQALHRATTEDWSAVQREAAAVRDAARRLAPEMAAHEYTRDDMHAIANAVIALGAGVNEARYAEAEQIALSLEAIVTGMKSWRYIEPQSPAVDAAMATLLASFDQFGARTDKRGEEEGPPVRLGTSPNRQGFRPDGFARGLRDLQRAIGR